MLKRFFESHPGYEARQSTYEEFAPQALAESKKFGSIIALYGAATYFEVNSYQNIEKLLQPGGNYFLMFYRPGYYPEHIYTTEDIENIKKKQDFGAIAAAFENKYIFSKYLVATNLKLGLEEFSV
ncbi:MAG: hypothetical protein RI933_771 [Actinomycetota bacterium]|jgi:hypothetical protein